MFDIRDGEHDHVLEQGNKRNTTILIPLLLLTVYILAENSHFPLGRVLISLPNFRAKNIWLKCSRMKENKYISLMELYILPNVLKIF